MAIFPKIQQPCPYQANLSAIMDGDTCRMCKRQVVDLTAMSDGERVDFFADCETEVCVSYRVPIRSALGAAALAAAAVADLPAAAQEIATPVLNVETPAVDIPAVVAVANGLGDPVTADPGTADAPLDEGEEVIVVAGGIRDARNVEMVEVAEDANVPELPVVYETPAQAPSKRN